MTKTRRTQRTMEQTSIAFPNWGGAREGSGRKRTGPRGAVEHRARPAHNRRQPVHVSVRLEPGLESLRKRSTYRVVREAIADGCRRFGLCIVEYSVMTNHVHLVCEAEDERALSRGMKGLCVRLARRLNALWDRAGRVIADRYHARALKTPREVRNVLNYVFQNAHHHGIHFAGPDPCSSGGWFEGWDRALGADPCRGASPLPRARTWLLSVGWKRHGPITLDEPRRFS